MNNYNYDYMNYVNSIPNNMMLDPNYLMNNINNNYINIPQNEIIPNSNNQILEPYEGLIRGNIFDNLYDQYKNYSPYRLNPNNEKEALLQQWQQYNFAIIDLNLYLDTNPNDKNALSIYREFLNILNQLQDKYESKYGPIELSSNCVSNNTWEWNNSPWPWEVIKNV